MGDLDRVLKMNGQPVPIRFRYSGSAGSPQAYQRVRLRGCTWPMNLLIGQKAVNDLHRRSQPVTLTVYPSSRLTVTLTARDRYGRIQ